MDWDDLRFVLALSREKTLSGAANTLGLTHTTVARRLEALQAGLGVRLFDKTPNGYQSTPAGHDLTETAERLEAEVLAAEGRVLGRDVALRGALRVTTMDRLFQRHEATFASFLARYPSIELTVTTTDAEASLTRREADVALRMTNTPPEGLIGRKVGRADFAVFASKALVKRVRRAVGRRPRLGEYPWLHWDERLGMRWLDHWLAKHAPGAKIALRLDGTTAVVHAAIAAGLGVFFLAVEDGEADARLERVGPVAAEFSRDVWLLVLPELRANVRVRAFLDHFESELRSRR